MNLIQLVDHIVYKILYHSVHEFSLCNINKHNKDPNKSKLDQFKIY